jgi:hypothetical protein
LGLIGGKIQAPDRRMREFLCHFNRPLPWLSAQSGEGETGSGSEVEDVNSGGILDRCEDVFMEEDFGQVVETIETGHFLLIVGKRVRKFGKGMESYC